jgi:hypothetical protein
MADDIVLDVFESEIAPGDRGETFDPISDGELFGRDVLCHQAPPIPMRPLSGPLNDAAQTGFVNEL